MRDKILKMLEDADGFVSGQELCEKLGVSRTAVWKVIGALREEGYVIDSVSRRGYHLVECPDILRQEDLTAALTTRWMGRSLQVYDVTDSTNVRAKQQAEEGAPEGHLVMADMQSAGRGSRGRSWDSPRGTGIFMSLVLRPQLIPQQAAMVTLTAAYSIVSVLREDYGVAAGIKWPNDVVLNRKKLVGILNGDECGAGSDPLYRHRHRHQREYEGIPGGAVGQGHVPLDGDGKNLFPGGAGGPDPEPAGAGV